MPDIRGHCNKGKEDILWEIKTFLFLTEDYDKYKIITIEIQKINVEIQMIETQIQLVNLEIQMTNIEIKMTPKELR